MQAERALNPGTGLCEFLAAALLDWILLLHAFVGSHLEFCKQAPVPLPSGKVGYKCPTAFYELWPEQNWPLQMQKPRRSYEAWQRQA